MEAFKALPPEEQRLLGLTIPFLRPYVIGLALANGVALIGLAYGFMIKTLLDASPFLLGALALTAWHYPRLGPLIDRGRKLDRHEEEEQAVALVERIAAKVARASQSQPPPPARKSVARAPSQPLKPSASEPPPPRRPAREQGPIKR
jgi:hypothetical protein